MKENEKIIIRHDSNHWTEPYATLMHGKLYGDGLSHNAYQIRKGNQFIQALYILESFDNVATTYVLAPANYENEKCQRIAYGQYDSSWQDKTLHDEPLKFEPAATKIEIGGFYFFPDSYHFEIMQVDDIFNEIDYNVDPFTNGEPGYFKAVKVRYMNGSGAGQYITLDIKTLQNSALPVPSEKIETYFDNLAGKNKPAIVPDALPVVNVEGHYLELSNGVWLRSLNDGRYIDDESKCFYAPTFFIKRGAMIDEYEEHDPEYQYTGRFIRLGLNRSMKG